MSQSHRSRAAGRTTSVLSAAGFCLGIPALLCRAAGWPLPRRLPAFSTLVDAFSGGWRPDDRFVISALAVIAWVVWAQIGTVAILELKAMRSGQRAQTLPFSAWSRPIAIRLAATLAVLAPFAPRAAGAAPLPQPAAITVTTPAAAQAETTPAPTTLLAALDPTPASTTYVVRADDTLWDLAETHLGDPMRYREIFELNRGRLQHDGRRLEHAEFLRPGWRLELPVPAPAAPEAPVPSVPPSDGEASQDASLQVACTPAPSEPASAGTDAVIPQSPPADPTQPSHAAPASAPTPASTSPAPAPASDRTGPLTVAQIGLPSMTAGVLLGYLGRLRRDRERRRRFRHRFLTSTPQQATAERRVRAVARAEAPTWVDLAVRHLASSLHEDGAPPPPAVLAVRAGDLGVEVLVSPPWPVAPGRFLPVDDGHTWRLDPALALADLATLAKDCPAYIPALVTVGDTDSGSVLIDLDEAGTLTVEGEGEQVTGVLIAMAAELAAAPWSESCDIVLIGLDETLARLERVCTVSPADALAQLVPLAGNPGVSGLADGAQGDIPSGPTIAIVGPGSLEADDLHALLDAAKPHSGLCVIAAAGTGAPGRNRLVGCPDGTGVLYPLGLSIVLARPSATSAELVALVTSTAGRDADVPTAADSSDVPPTDAPLPSAESEAPADSESPADEPAAEEEDPVEQVPERVVEVRLLGPVEITWQHHTPKRQVAELVSYLAVHPKGVTPDQARLALWPATADDEHFGERAPATYHALTTKARAALGQDRAGQSLILREVNNSLRLSPSVGCDWLDFEQHVRAARRDPKRAIDHLRAALSLVRGRPFEGWSFAWIEVERLDGAMEAALADAAQELAALALAQGDLDTARFAVEQGLRAVPSAEALLRYAMRVAAAAGDRAALERAWRDAQRVAANLDALAEPEPETAELYESLRRSMNGEA